MATKTKDFGKIYAAKGTAEQESWKAHRKFVRENVSVDACGYRACIGIAMLSLGGEIIALPDGDGIRTFVANNDAKWLTLVDVPVGHWTLHAEKREVHVAAVRQAERKFGLPFLTSVEHEYDFRKYPCVGSAVDTVDPSDLQAFKVFNALERAMTSTACHFRQEWAGTKPAWKDFSGSDVPFAFGESGKTNFERPQLWMPRPFFGFPYQDKSKIFDRVTGIGVARPVYPRGLLVRFVEALEGNLAYYAKFNGQVAEVTRTSHCGQRTLMLRLVGERGEQDFVPLHEASAVLHKGLGERFEFGDAIAIQAVQRGLPSRWRNMNFENKCDHIQELPEFHHIARTWFEREAISVLPGVVHYPSQIAGLAVTQSLDVELYWELRKASIAYVRDDCEALIFPTIQIAKWDELTGVLPGEVNYDFTPKDTRFIPRKKS
jgi:hypothetical protein